MKPAVVRAHVGLGSNLEEPVLQLQRAIAALAATEGISVRRVSRFYRTAPWGEVAQPDFVNAVAELDVRLTAEALLQVLLRIEQATGRQRTQRWGPRTLDLDLLLFGEFHCDTAQLQLPHPRMHERAFVLAPLAELVPQQPLGLHGTVAQALAALDCSGVRLLRLPTATGDHD